SFPAYFTAANAEHPRYPQARFIGGTGISSVSAEDAAARATENVVQQISTRLESETSSFQLYTTKRGAAEAATGRVSVWSSFDRADLILLVDRANQGGTFYAYAVLDRAAADRELAAAMSAELTTFRAAAASAASEAIRIRPRIDSAFIVRRAVTGQPAPEEAEYVAARNQLLATIEEARGRRVVGVVLKNAGAGQLADLTASAVRRLGLRPDAAGCAARDKKDLTDATQLEVAPEERCSEGSLGERCDVIVRLTAQACAGGLSGAGTVATVRGVHPSDREKARRSAWDKVTAQAVEAAVRDALKGTVLAGE
ncbi:MAG TPA: hypothetical protein VIH41_05385, partial [Myxococcales bacterium]